MRRWLPLLALLVVLSASALARPVRPTARVVSAATGTAASRLPALVPAVGVSPFQQVSTLPLLLTTVDCTHVPQTFTLSGTPGPLQTNYSGAQLLTNEPATAISSLNLTVDVSGNPLFIPGPAPGPNPLTLSAGGIVAGGQEILLQPFVKAGAPDAFVELIVPGQTPQILSCVTSTVPTVSRSLLVSNIGGEDLVDCTNASLAGSTFCSTFGSLCVSLDSCPNNCQSQSPPCATIQYAIGQARDGDTITITGTPIPYMIGTTIEVPILVTISGDGNKVVLESANGDPIFHVTAVGSAAQHVAISGLILGGTTSASNPGAIQLDGDSFTDVANNFIGQEDLPNGIGILLHNSDHPTIDSNVIHGSTVFTGAAELQVGAITSGFGIVTAECLGAPEPSDSVTITNNLINANANAGIWLCSDQGGGHTVSSNTVRNNARGIVLFNVVDSTLNANYIDDNLGDGIQVVGESANDTLSGNFIESQTGKDSAGIRLYGNGGVVFPLNTMLTGNFLRRNTFDVVIAGARATTLSTNTIEAGDYRTGVYLLVGSLLGGGESSQPTDTVLSGNTLLYDGFCTAAAGCAIRLAPGVVTSVDAHSNNYGFPATSLAEIRTVVWDQSQDPSLGPVFVSGTPPLNGAATAPPTPAIPAIGSTPATATPGNAPTEAPTAAPSASP